MSINTGYGAENVPFAQRSADTVMLTDGVRARKTDTGYVLEVLQSDENWSGTLPGTPWNSGITYAAGEIKLDRNGFWKALATNTNSRPVSGNTDWELVGGTPYVDVVLDPVQLTTAPFYDPTDDGPGFPVLDAPGENLVVVPVIVDAFPTPGDPWGDTPNTQFVYTSVLEGFAEGTIYVTTDISLTDINASPGAPPASLFINPNRTNLFGLGSPYIQLIVNDVRLVANAPLVMFTDRDITNTGSGTQVGTRSVRYRIYYDIVSVVASDTVFFHITAVDQGTKTITVNGDASALTGSITVAGNTGTLDGDYTIDTVTFDTDHTDIVTVEALPDDTADGWVKQ